MAITRVWQNGTGIPISAANMNAIEADLDSKMPKWKPLTTYAAGEFVVSPLGDIVKANAAFTSGVTYNATNWVPSNYVAALVSRIANTEAKDIAQDSRLTTLEATPAGQADVKAVKTKIIDMKPRPLIGARAGSGSGVSIPDANYFDLLHELERDMNANLDISNWYRAVSTTSAAEFTATIAAELAAYPNRKILYVLEMGKSNAQFNMEMSNQIGIYPYLLATLQAIKDSGFDDRVFIAPFHECNGAGPSYAWQMYDTSVKQLYTPFSDDFKHGTNYGASFRHNTPANYKTAYQSVVTMARSIGLKSKFVQWFLNANSGNSLTVDGIERMDLTPGYAGDDYVDIVGLSYYNRAGDPSKSDSFGPPGANGLREFYDAFENLTRNPLWICETGASSNPYGEKAPWYADLVRLVASEELPRIEAMIMFLQDSTKLDGDGVPIKGADMQLDGLTQRQFVGRAITAAKMGTRAVTVPEIHRNLLPIVVTDMTTTAGWTATSGVTLSISNDYTPNLDINVNGLHITKPAWSAGADPVSTADDDLHAKTTFTVYRSIASSWLDYEINAPYALTFWARASVSNFRIEAGIRQDGGFALSLGDELVLGPYWEQYVVPWAAMTPDNGSWRIPNFNFGNNTFTYPTWFEVADMRRSRGVFPEPNIERFMRPRVRTLGNATNLTWNCQGAELYKVTLTGAHTLMAPTGTAYDGQELTLRVTQDATGGRTLNLHANFYSGSLNPTLATGPGAKTLLKFHYDDDLGRWGLVSTSVWNLT